MIVILLLHGETAALGCSSSALPDRLLLAAGYVHDWCSHGGSTFRDFSLCLRFHHLLQLGQGAELLVVSLIFEYHLVSNVLFVKTGVKDAGLLRFELVC